MRFKIDLYPGDHALEDVPAEFTVEDVPADPLLGEQGGKWATLESIQVGGLTIIRGEVQIMVGFEKVYEIERDLSERLSSNIAGAAVRYA